MNLYPFLRRGYDGGISADANFSSFVNSLFTLFKSATGDKWNLILGDSVR